MNPPALAGGFFLLISNVLGHSLLRTTPHSFLRLLADQAVGLSKIWQFMDGAYPIFWENPLRTASQNASSQLIP
jgi:hypothetical protein